MDTTQDLTPPGPQTESRQSVTPDRIHYIRFRKYGQIFSAASRIQNLQTSEPVMVQTDHGLEPCIITGPGPQPEGEQGKNLKASFTIARRTNREETGKFDRLLEREKEAFDICNRQIEKRQLQMKLVSVERFFNGSKIIFYFTAENRIDFRELVKDLVQEFRTRVEMRQIGVRHETKMIGGLGCCGRELCCSSYIKVFAPVSIKMAKAQNLPLNPAKISGICNRLLCCLTYEYKTYHEIRKNMPKPGKMITLNGQTTKVLGNDVLQETITVIDPNDHESRLQLTRAEWGQAVQEEPKKISPKPKKKRHPKPPKKRKKEKAKSSNPATQQP